MSVPRLSWSVRKAGPWTIAEVGGEIDLATAPEFRRLLLGCLDDTSSLVVDLSKTEYLDSTGLGVLIGVLRQTKALGGQLRLAGLQRRVRQVFQITHLNELFAIYDTAEDALGRVGGPR
ncbi:MAG: STAS domain-containing protein [Streptomycetales bacterium]